jgi:hypothetical protein
MEKAKKNPTNDFDADGARKVLLGVGLLGAGLLTAAVIGFAVVRKRERGEEPYNDFYAFLGVGA